MQQSSKTEVFRPPFSFSIPRMGILCPSEIARDRTRERLHISLCDGSEYSGKHRLSGALAARQA
jgi:hypothetical protein